MSFEISETIFKICLASSITALKERNGSSRSSIKKVNTWRSAFALMYSKFIATNHKSAIDSKFDAQFNLAIKRGVKVGYFSLPKGSSGTGNC